MFASNATKFGEPDVKHRTFPSNIRLYQSSPHPTLKTPCTKCINIDDVNKGIKKMASGKATNITYVSSELLKWTRPHNPLWIMTIIEQAIKQGFPNDWLMNWIKPIFKSGDKN